MQPLKQLARALKQLADREPCVFAPRWMRPPTPPKIESAVGVVSQVD